MRKKLIFFATSLALLGGAFFWWAAPRYDALVAQDEQVQRTWADIEVVLQRRYDLIPQLTATIIGNNQQEKEVFLGLAGAHQAYLKADNINQRIEASQKTEGYLSRLLFAGRVWPSLKGQPLYSKLMNALEGTENQIASKRLEYNQEAAKLNSIIRSIEGQVTSRLANISVVHYYKPQEFKKKVPQVNFATKAGVETEKSPPLDPTSKASISTIRFQGTIQDKSQVKALLVLPSGKSLSVKKGDKIEQFQATVVSVDSSGVVLDYQHHQTRMRTKLTR